MNKREKRNLKKIIISAVITLVGLIVSNYSLILGFLIYLVAYLIIGFDILKKSFKNIIHGSLFDENFLMSVATIGAFITKEYLEGVLVMLLYQIGELFQSYAVNKSRKSIASLMDIKPEFANVLIDDKIVTKKPNDVKIDDIIVVRPGEKVPLDGIVIEGSSMLDTKALTGESMPRSVDASSNILNGSINMSGMLKIKVTKLYSNSTVSKILELVSSASDKKAKSEKFITKFAKYYTPIVVFLALALAILPPLIIPSMTFAICAKRALTFLVISCPCALVISVPLSFFGGIGGASKKGILIKGSNYIEILSKVDTIVFDKTGTLTEGKFSVNEINNIGISKEELLKLTAYAEYHSNHPLALSIKEAYRDTIDQTKIKDIKEIPGKGVTANINGKKVSVGNIDFISSFGITIDNTTSTGTILYVMVDNKYSGNIVVSDTIKKEALEAISNIRKNHNIKKLVMLTGDTEEVALKVSKKLDLDEYYSSLLPKDKVDKTEELLKTSKTLAFVGDGINDAPVLVRADVGISMGLAGSDAAIEASDVVIMNDNLNSIKSAINISLKTMKIVKENIFFALLIKILFLTLGALGLASMMMAVFADVGVSIIAILNAIRTLYFKE